MRFAMLHRTLANLTEDFCLSVFETGNMKDLSRQALDKTGKWHRRNCPLKAPFVLWFVIMLSIFRYKSIPNLLRLILIAERKKEPTLCIRSVTPEAICHARARLSFEPMRELFEMMAEQTIVDASFHGFRVWGVDGVNFLLPDTEENAKAYGRPGTGRGVSAFPQIQAVALVSATTHHIRDCVFSPYNTSERAALDRVTKHLGQGDLLLNDRGFSSVEVFDLYMQRKFHFLSRIGSHWHPIIIKTLGPGDSIVRVSVKSDEWGWSCKGNRKRRARILTTLTLRMIEYKVGNSETFRLLTDLLDDRTYPTVELARLYHQRWECELSYDELKTHLVTVKHGGLHTDFRSKTPEGVIQEAYGMLIAYNLIRGLMAAAAEIQEVSPLELSFVGTLQIVESSLPQFEEALAQARISLARRLLEDIGTCRVDRPRRQRMCPRKVRIKMSNFGLKRSTDREIVNTDAKIYLVECL